LTVHFYRWRENRHVKTDALRRFLIFSAQPPVLQSEANSLTRICREFVGNLS
jgi:hypothetical protein